MSNDWKATTMFSSPILMGDNTVPGVKIPKEIQDILPTLFQVARDFGLDFFDQIIEWMTYDGISEIAALGGFPQRYPHWRFGMEYEELSKGYEFGMHRISEMIVNCCPSVMYCLDSNSFTDNVTVILHALGHNHFFKNNIWFKPTNKSMMSQFGNHRTKVLQIMSRWGEEKVESFIDDCLAIDSLIDPASAWNKSEHRDPVFYDEREYEFPRRLKVPEGHDYMEEWINPKKWVNDEWKRINIEEKKKSLGIIEMYDRDIVKFLLENAPLKPWEQTVLSIIYDEAMYFVPQGATKVCNEAHACVLPDTLIYTSKGILKIKDIVDNKLSVNVFDGEENKKIINWFEFKDKEIYKITTKRGYTLSGSDSHRILMHNNKWKRLEDIKIGDEVDINIGGETWARPLVKINWSNKRRLSAEEISRKHGISVNTFERFKRGGGTSNDKVKKAKEEYDLQLREAGGVFTQSKRRKEILVPEYVTNDVASLLGFLTGDGHISEGRYLGFTNGEEYLADRFIELSAKLFNVRCIKKWDDSSPNGRWRVKISNQNLKEFLTEYLKLPKGICAKIKKIPDVILKSPKQVMSAFLRAYFDCDACACPKGVILSTSSPVMAKQVQTVLLNYGIISSITEKRKKGYDINYHISIGGESVKVYYQNIGFNSPIKQEKLCRAVYGHPWFNKQNWVDTIVSIEKLENQTVYDISVEDTHKYSSQGFINHNSYVDFNLMARVGVPGCSIWEYADHKSKVLGGKDSQNPYKLGFELLMNIEERWDKGRFGKEYEECRDNQKKENWDLKLGLGKEKVFEVIEQYNDVTLISEFFTEEFCTKNKFYTWSKFPSTEPGVEAEYQIVDRDWKKARRLLIQRYLNRGLPEIRLVDPNGRGKNILVLRHVWDGRTLQPRYSREGLRSLANIWRKPVALLTKTIEGRDLIYYCSEELEVKELKRNDWLTL